MPPIQGHGWGSSGQRQLNAAHAHLHDTPRMPPLGWKTVQSSSIKRVRYWVPGTEDCLDVEFIKSGKIARYENVPWSVYFAMMGAASVGTYHWEVIRNYGADDRYTFFYI